MVVGFDINLCPHYYIGVTIPLSGNHGNVQAGWWSAPHSASAAVGLHAFSAIEASDVCQDLVRYHFVVINSRNRIH